MLNTVINGALSKSVYPEEIGGTLGLRLIESLTRVISPALGGILLQYFTAWGPAIFCGVIMIWVAVLYLAPALCESGSAAGAAWWRRVPLRG